MAQEFNFDVFTVNRQGAEPIYRQLIQQIQILIDSGRLSVGTRLPATRELAEGLGISRISVVNAYAELRSQAYLCAHSGRGTFVASRETAITQNTEPYHSRKVQDTRSHSDSLRKMMRHANKPNVINFSHGSPPKEFFPVRALQKAINTVLEQDGVNALSYEDPEGFLPLRVAVRDYVSALGILCRSEDVLITGGAQQGLDLIIQALMQRGDVLITSRPTYVGVLDSARARRVRVQTIECDEEGIRLDMLENVITEQKPSLIYCIPDFHNPTGLTMPLHRRRQLLRLAAQYGVPVVEDAVYHEMRYEGEQIPPLKALDEENNVLHINAFTKMLLPGMRIGYLVTTRQHHGHLARIKQAADVSTPSLNQRAILHLLERGVLNSHLERLNRELKIRRDTAIEALEKFMPEGTYWQIPQGGLYLWIHLPEYGPTSAELFLAAVQQGVAFAIGNIFFPDGDGSYYIRLNYSLQSKQKITEGIRRLSEAWQELTRHRIELRQSPVL